MIDDKNDSSNSKIEVAITRPIRRFAKDVLAYLFPKLILSVIVVAHIFLFTRLLTPETYGVYSLLMAIISPIGALLTQWAAQPIGRYYSEYKKHSLYSYRTTVNTLFTLVILVGFVISVWLLLFVNFWWGIFMGIAAGLLLLLQALYQLLLPILPASLNPGFYGLLQILNAFLAFGFSLTLIFLIGPQPESLLFGTVLGLTVVLFMLFYKVSQQIGKLQFSFHLTPDLLRFVRYGSPLMLWFFAAQLLNIGDRYVLQIFRGSTEVGIYCANYNFISGIANFLGAPISMAAFPIIMHMWTYKKRDEIGKTLSIMTEWHLLLGIGLLGCIAVGANKLLSLVLGESFREGYKILLPVLAGIILFQASILGHKGMELMEKTYLMLILVCIAAIANLLLNIIFVPIYGYLAAAYTTLLSYGLYTVLVWIFSKRFVPWHIPLKSIVLGIVICVLAVAFVQILQSSGSLVEALIGIMIFAGLYVMGISIMEWPLIRQVLLGRRDK